ncbi:hypothetical protein SAMN04489806_0946 [Paramicrobacterium humi]|uniref:1,4-alpha-glucan branching enzyme n=1 Tax=Paramicrobacterium humi TaxID=640635 RepID=A0A1H4JZM2_9MICO|nr:hypothetical protein [Microbacterium humi]SEB51744.1 hypothetical protein SAMN04489806_0946 [Microbacterium humi]
MADGTHTNGGDDELRTGPDMSESAKRAQVIASREEKPDHDGATLATASHDVIVAWAEARGGTPATVEATEQGDRLGVLEIDFVHDDGSLREVSWDEWFGTFDERRLNFIYQETKSDGSQSTFFRLDNPEREDA